MKTYFLAIPALFRKFENEHWIGNRKIPFWLIRQQLTIVDIHFWHLENFVRAFRLPRYLVR